MAASVGRRGFVGGGAAAVSTVLWAPRRSLAAQPMGFAAARHLLSRAGFGGTPADIDAIAGQDPVAAVDRLLSASAERRAAITSPPSWVGEGPASLRRRQQAADAERAEAQRKAGVDGNILLVERPVEQQGRELRNWWVEEMLVTDRPLVERMVMFWHGHFTSSFLKVRYAPALFRQNTLFRREALGNFATLLREVARDPAMLIYLDGMRSVARQPNENFARELLELFTLGEGHYGEADIREAARAFTGWSVDRETGLFRVRDGAHDDGPKTVLGQTGRFGGDDVIAILLRHPRTAETVVEKLWREFVSLTPEPATVQRLAAEFRRDYEIRPLLRALLLTPAFHDPANRAGLIKSPIDLIVGTVRLLGLPVPEKTALVRMMQSLGQTPFDPPNVRGWAGGESWVTTYTLLLRQQFLRRIVEATTVAPVEDHRDGPSMAGRADGDAMAMADRPIEGRSLRQAGNAARLGPTLAGTDPATLLQTLLPCAPIDMDRTPRSAGATAAMALLDTAYQLK